MRPATLLVSALLSTLAQSCAPPKPTEPESTAVYREPTAAAPVPITRLSVNEPTPEPLGAAAPVEPAAASTEPAKPSATSEDAASKSAEPAPASPAPAAPVPPAPAPAGPSTAPSATPSPPGAAPSPPPAKK